MTKIATIGTGSDAVRAKEKAEELLKGKDVEVIIVDDIKDIPTPTESILSDPYMIERLPMPKEPVFMDNYIPDNRPFYYGVPNKRKKRRR